MNTLYKNSNIHLENDIYEILMNSFDGIAITDAIGHYLSCSKLMMNLLNVSENEIANMTVYDFVEKGYYSPSTIISSLKSKKQETAAVKVFYERGNKEKYNLLLSTTTPVLDKNGNIKYTITNTRKDTIIDHFKQELEVNSKYLSKYKKYVSKLNDMDEPVCYSTPMKRIFKLCRELGNSESTILLTGESGVGKEVVSKYIHKYSNRSNEPFIAVNCGAMPSELVESELFG